MKNQKSKANKLKPPTTVGSGVLLGVISSDAHNRECECVSAHWRGIAKGLSNKGSLEYRPISLLIRCMEHCEEMRLDLARKQPDLIPLAEKTLALWKQAGCPRIDWPETLTVESVKSLPFELDKLILENLSCS